MTDESGAEVRPADPCALVIFGAAGDLTRRKLLPALHNLARNGLVTRDLAIVGVAMDPLTDETFRARLAEAARELGPAGVDAGVLAAQQARCFYVAGRFDDPAAYARLRDRLAEVHRGGPTGGNTLFYLATPPAFFATIAEQLGAAGLVRAPGTAGGWTRLIVEKPFGRDLASARELNRRLLAVFDEAQIHRIDHYLGKETVQNILLLRFLNGIFEPIWNRRYVDHVQLTVAETLGVEGRGGYYETAGALRDIVQNHMLQLVCLVAMEPPISLVGEAVRDEKVKVLRAIRPLTAAELREATVRGQYGAGRIDGTAVPAYRDEPSVARDSVTETFAALRLFIENWRWAEVPFYLRTGKRLAAHDTEIVVQFRRAPLALLPPEAGPQQPNRLTIHIQPDERITLRFEAKRPGPHLRMTPVEMQFAYDDLEGDSRSTGYETLLYDCMVGDPMLFHRADMVEAAWTVVTPILEAWAASPPRDFPNYAAGSWGPAVADALLARDGRRWVPPE
ncbi:MAG TPA: glucose-6-phosphate dehydrogenase [Candidatus Binatia bacterium]|nr:glucose-6-phosphate dehydrogenase [Candidatus Binatia bacterium]